MGGSTLVVETAREGVFSNLVEVSARLHEHLRSSAQARERNTEWHAAAKDGKYPATTREK